MSVKRQTGRIRGQSGVFASQLRKPQETPRFNVASVMGLTIPTDLLNAEQPALCSIDCESRREGQSMLSLVALMAKAHAWGNRNGNPDEMGGQVFLGSKSTVIEYCPLGDDTQNSDLYFNGAMPLPIEQAAAAAAVPEDDDSGSEGEAGGSGASDSDMSLPGSSRKRVRSTLRTQQAPKRRRLVGQGGSDDERLVDDEAEEGEEGDDDEDIGPLGGDEGGLDAFEDPNDEFLEGDDFAGEFFDAEETLHHQKHQQFAARGEGGAYDREDYASAEGARPRGDPRGAAHGRNNGQSFLEQCQVAPSIAALRVYFSGEYNIAQALIETIATNQLAVSQLMDQGAPASGSTGSAHKGRSQRPQTAREIAATLANHRDKSLSIHSLDQFIRAICVAVIGKNLSEAGMQQARLHPIDDPANPICIHRTLGLKGMVRPSMIKIHPDFRTPANYVSDGAIDSPRQLCLPHHDMALVVTDNEGQSDTRLMHTILPPMIPDHLHRPTLAEKRFVDTYKHRVTGIAEPNEHPAESHFTTASDAFRMDSSTSRFAALHSIESLKAMSDLEMNKFETARRQRKQNRVKGVTDQMLRDHAWISFVDVQERLFSSGSVLLDPKNASHSEATGHTMEMLSDYLSDHNNTLFRLQTRAFSNLSALSSWVAMRGLALERIYGASTAHHMIMRMHLSVLNAPDMNPDKVHHLAIGQGATSKSYALDIVMSWAVPGQAEDVAHKTAMADTVPVNKDGGVEGWHEGNPDWFGVSANGKTSTNPAESRFKKRLTSGVMDVEACSLDEEGNRISIMYKRPCNVSVLVNLNLSLGQISQPMLTRFLVSQSSNVPRPGKSMAHCICSTPTISERITKKDDRDNMQWMMMMVTITHTLIRAGLLPEIKTPVTDRFVPKILEDAAAYGLNHVDAPRHLLRLKAAVRAYVVTRAILRVFASPSSPLAVKNPTTGVYTGKPFTMHAFALLAFHLTDAADASILSTAMGMVKDQWESRTRFPVIEAIMSLFFSCPEEAYDESEDAEHRDRTRAELGVTKEAVDNAVAAWELDGVVAHSVGITSHASTNWKTMVAAQRDELTQSLRDPNAHGLAIRVLLAGGADAADALRDMLDGRAPEPASAPPGPAPVASRQETKIDAMPTEGDTENPFAYAEGRSLLGEGSVVIPPQRNRSDLPNHPRVHCSCCVCIECCDARQTEPARRPSYIKAQFDLLRKKQESTFNSAHRNRRGPLGGARGQLPQQGLRPPVQRNRSTLSSEDQLSQLLGAVVAPPATDHDAAQAAGRESTVQIGNVAVGVAGTRGTMEELIQAGLSKVDAVKICYEARQECTDIDPAAALKALRRVEPDHALGGNDLDILPSDHPSIRQVKMARLMKAVDDAQKRIRRARHLEQARFEIIDSQFSGTHVTSQPMFHREADISQCIGELSKQICRRLRGYTSSAVSAALWEMMDTTTPICAEDGTIKYLPAMRLNAINRGITISKAMLINNRKDILKHLLRSMLEHRFTINMTHLFGEDPDPDAEPYLFDTFTPMARRKDPYQRPVDAANTLTTLALEHAVSHSVEARGVVRGLNVEERRRKPTRPPEDEALFDHLNTMAVRQDIAVQYKFLPEYLLMDQEMAMLQQDQASWEKLFIGSIKYHINTNNASVQGAFTEARNLVGPRPLDMLHYPPLPTNHKNDDVVPSDMDDLDWVMRWKKMGLEEDAASWERLLRREKVAVTKLQDDFEEWADTAHIDMVDYSLDGSEKHYMNFVNGVQKVVPAF